VIRKPVIARRRLKLKKRNKTVTLVVRIRQPYLEKRDYVCDYEVIGFAEPIRESAFGVDSLQALLIAITFIQKRLRPYRHQLSWLGSESDDGLLYEAEQAQRVLKRVAAAHPRDSIDKAHALEAETRDRKSDSFTPNVAPPIPNRYRLLEQCVPLAGTLAHYAIALCFGALSTRWRAQLRSSDDDGIARLADPGRGANDGIH
jgi:hypothetical protein